MTLSALLARLRPLRPFLVAHWRLVAVVTLAVVAALGLRGCASWRGKAEGAEAHAKASDAQLRAEFDAALLTARQESAALAARLDAAQKQGGTPVAVFSGHSDKQKVPPLPAAPVRPIVPPAASAGNSSPPAELPCVLHVNDEYEFKLTGAQIKRGDGAQLVLADVALEADNGLKLSAVVEAPITLPPIDLVTPGVEIKRSRFSVRGGLVDPWKLSGGYLGGGVRVFRGWWLESDARVTSAEQSIGVGLRYDW